MLRKNLFELNDELLMELDLPGIPAEAITLHVEPSRVRLAIARDEPRVKGVERVHRCERLPASFMEHIDLPVAVDRRDVQAVLRDGVLRIRIGLRDSSETVEYRLERPALGAAACATRALVRRSTGPAS